MTLKLGVAAFITAINISVYCIWIPARLQISAKYESINNIWDRCEKVIYLLVDAALNYYFVRIVQRRLVDQGCERTPSFFRSLQIYSSVVLFAPFFGSNVGNWPD